MWTDGRYLEKIAKELHTPPPSPGPDWNMALFEAASLQAHSAAACPPVVVEPLDQETVAEVVSRARETLSPSGSEKVGIVNSYPMPIEHHRPRRHRTKLPKQRLFPFPACVA